jgi:hypothetical protein
MTDRELMQMALHALELTNEPRYFSQREAIRRLQSRLAQREWVGLTDKEVEDIYVNTMAYDAIRVAEAKLKEKNT